MTFSLEPGDHGVLLRFRNTVLRSWATAISLLALCLLTLAVPPSWSTRAARATSVQPDRDHRA